jgi:hypothetical protein
MITSWEIVKKSILQMWFVPVQILVLVDWLVFYATTAGPVVNLAFALLTLVVLLGDYITIRHIMRQALLKFVATQMEPKTSDSETK